MNKPRIVAIIGSSRFKAAHLGIAQKVTLQGKIPLIAGFFHHVDCVPLTDDQKGMIDQLMLHKINMADEVFVVNVNGYIGKTTRQGIEHARQSDKPITFMEPEEALVYAPPAPRLPPPPSRPINEG